MDLACTLTVLADEGDEAARRDAWLSVELLLPFVEGGGEASVGGIGGWSVG